ncbi:energy-coupling factor ABC transporter ATP-binding protein [Dehalobacter sp. DCM]|uniref:energy-coupling factor ABC transporter ATP-binding protein n=1 Tax=Dehalobacter sp. DCM TaxID=2907827 RepID=UPI003081B484|nr:energy-coupling factor ABC transporter ATP-binding protein [Dehalobacter sp. DCM]
MITFENVCFSYGKSPVICDVSFQINKGDFVAVIGENGAGKSTLSKLCNGLLKPTSGRVTVNGNDTRTTRTSSLAKIIGFLFQNPDRQICQNTISGEIMFGLECVLDDVALRHERCEDMLRQFDFDGMADPFTLSRGDRQRVTLASLLACRPEVLILDEPTTGLDYRECTHIMELIRELNEAGTTIIMVTHDMELVQDYAQRVLVINSGKLIGDGAAKSIMTKLDMLAAASVAPAQIPALALRLGSDFQNVFTVEQMTAIIERKAGEKDVRIPRLCTG